MLTPTETQAAQAFWKWFEENHLPFEFLTGMTPEQIQDVSNQLHQAVYPYCEGLSPQASGRMESEDGFQLVISAAGKIQYFEKAKALVALAPEIPNWYFHALQPPLPRHVRIRHQIGGDVLDPNDIWLLTMVSEEYSNNLGVHLALKLYDECDDNEDDLHDLKVFLIQLVVQIIGEESWAMDIQHLEIGPLPPAPHEKGYAPLYDLPDIIAEFRKDHPSPMLEHRKDM